VLTAATRGLRALWLPWAGCLRHRRAPRKQISAEGSALPVPACPGQRWDAEQAATLWGSRSGDPSTCTLGSQHGRVGPSSPAPACGWAPAEILCLCAGARGHADCHKATALGGGHLTSPPALCTRGPETRGRVGGGMAAGESRLLGQQERRK